MNKKIKELAAESKLMAFIESEGLEIIYAHDVTRVEKFAELIIRECASVVFKNTGPKSALNVLEHFGVEE